MGMRIVVCGLNGTGKSTLGKALAVLISVPREIRIQRIRNRSFQKFGQRMLEGGDLYEREERFFALASARSEEFVEAWARRLTCPVLRIDGTKPVEENINGIVERVHVQMGKMNL